MNVDIFFIKYILLYNKTRDFIKKMLISHFFDPYLLSKLREPERRAGIAEIPSP